MAPEMEARIVAELRDAIARTVKEKLSPPTTNPRAPRFFVSGMRLLMADIITKGLVEPQHGQTLTAATLFLREAWGDCEAAQRRASGASRPNGSPRGEEERERERWVLAMAQGWRDRHPSATQSAGLR
jgi:hypothetical protein